MSAITFSRVRDCAAGGQESQLYWAMNEIYCGPVKRKWFRFEPLHFSPVEAVSNYTFKERLIDAKRMVQTSRFFQFPSSSQSGHGEGRSWFFRI